MERPRPCEVVRSCPARPQNLESQATSAPAVSDGAPAQFCHEKIKVRTSNSPDRRGAVSSSPASPLRPVVAERRRFRALPRGRRGSRVRCPPFRQRLSARRWPARGRLIDSTTIRPSASDLSWMPLASRFFRDGGQRPPQTVMLCCFFEVGALAVLLFVAHCKTQQTCATRALASGECAQLGGPRSTASHTLWIFSRVPRTDRMPRWRTGAFGTELGA